VSASTSARTSVGAGYAAVCLALGIAGMLLPHPEQSVQPDFTLDGWRPDTGRLAAVRAADDALRAANPLKDNVREQMEAFMTLGRVEVATDGDINNPEYATATARARELMTAYWFSQGKEAYLALGLYAGQAFVEVITAVLNQASAERRPILAWLDANPEHKLVRRLHAYAGNFIENAVAWGLITPNNRLAGDTDALLRIHFKVRWCTLVTEITDYTFLMHEEELRALWRWRIEGDLTLPMDQRRLVTTWLRELEPDYPVYKSLGAVYARRGRYKKAALLYREALLDDPFNAKLATNLEFLLLAMDQIREVRL